VTHHPQPVAARTAFDPEALAELPPRSGSMADPALIVTQQGPERYQLIAGERRWQAAQMAGLTPCGHCQGGHAAAGAGAGAGREYPARDLNRWKRPPPFASRREFGLSQEQVAERVGKSRVAVTTPCACCACRPRSSKRWPTARSRRGTLGRCWAAHIAGAGDGRAARDQASAQRPPDEELVRRMIEPPQPKPTERHSLRRGRSRSSSAPGGTKVQLYRNEGAGRLVIHFYSKRSCRPFTRRCGGN